MGRRNRTLITEPSLFFVTTTLRDYRSLFSTPFIRTQVEEVMFKFIPGYADALMGYVIMPSHVHLLIGCKDGGRQLSKYMQALKSTVSRNYFKKENSIWVFRFDDLVIKTDKQFRIKLEYIHNNPVKSKLVSESTDWKWSSARFWLLDEPHPKLTKSWDWLD